MSPTTPAALGPTLRALPLHRRILVLTGAGISAASGIPTFRGPEGYWTVGSEVHAPETMATAAMFQRHPEEVWAWYLYRLGVCREAVPNTAHQALVTLRDAIGDRLTVVTQNVDGLHRRSGLPSEGLMEIHGDIELMRRADADGGARPLPSELRPLERGEALTDSHRQLLRDADGTWFRPHVLWFDESYDEENYFWDSAQSAAAQADLLIVVGSSGATNLPRLMASIAASRGCFVIDVNPEPSPFVNSSHEDAREAWLKGSAGDILPELVSELLAQ